MGILDKLLGRKKQEPRNTARGATGMDIQTDEQRAASRSKMEAELEANRAGREAAAEAAEEDRRA